MRRIPIFEDKPEGVVLDNTLGKLLAEGWTVDLGGNGVDDQIALVLGTPDDLRLLQPDELVESFGLRTDDESLKPGFAADYAETDDRGYIVYHGPYTFDAAATLMSIARATDSGLAA